jgi:hypothetical protein
MNQKLFTRIPSQSFNFYFEDNKQFANLHETVKEVINEELRIIYDGSSVENLNDKFLKKNAQDLECISEGDKICNKKKNRYIFVILTNAQWIFVFQAAKILHLTNPNEFGHISLVTNISDHLAGRTLKVFTYCLFCCCCSNANVS